MKINVTQEDIDRGGRDDAYRCPVARALCRIIGIDPEESKIEVDASSIIIWTDSQTLVWNMEDDSTAFVISFDSGQPVQPCTIEATCSV